LEPKRKGGIEGTYIFQNHNRVLQKKLGGMTKNVGTWFERRGETGGAKKILQQTQESRKKVREVQKRTGQENAKRPRDDNIGLFRGSNPRGKDIAQLRELVASKS